MSTDNLAGSARDPRPAPPAPALFSAPNVHAVSQPLLFDAPSPTPFTVPWSPAAGAVPAASAATAYSGRVLRPALARHPARELWPHQAEGKTLSVKILTDNPRATLIAPCGAGKTFTAVEICGELAPPHGRILFTGPSLELIAQILATLREGSRDPGRLIAVCSDVGAVARLHEADDRVLITTDAAVLAQELGRRGPAAVACTYHSLNVLAQAHRSHGVAPWSVAVVDEAHHTAGHLGRQWAAIHDDSVIPAQRRLYMTATPRVLVGGDDVATMDDEEVFGPVAYRLTFAQAIEDGLLADYRVVVVVIDSAEIRALIEQAAVLQAGRQSIEARTLAGQLAVLRACREFNARRVLTYHTRVADARGFARTIGSANALLPPQQRAEQLVGLHIDGKQPAVVRREAMDHLARAGQQTVVVSNVAVFGEGVDIPAVDAVAFLTGRDSPEATIQAVGRALRRDGRPDKVATIVIPIVLDPGQDPEQALETSAFSPVWRTIRALRAHDERLAQRLDAMRAQIGAAAGKHSDTAEQRPVQLRLPEWLTVTGVPLPPDFAEAIALKMVAATSSSWEEVFGYAAAYRERTGNLNPSDLVEPELAHWLSVQRQLNRLGQLPPDRKDRLDDLGIIWEPYDARWDGFYRLAVSYHAAKGHLNVGPDETWGDPRSRLGAWITMQRVRWDNLPQHRQDLLLAIGFDRRPQQTRWLAGFEQARAFHTEHGHLIMPQNQTHGPCSYPLGQWLWQQVTALRAGSLDPDREEQLDELGMIWQAKPPLFADEPERLETTARADLAAIVAVLAAERSRRAWNRSRVAGALQTTIPAITGFELSREKPPLPTLIDWANLLDRRLVLIDTDTGRRLPPGKPDLSGLSLPQREIAAWISTLHTRRKGWRASQTTTGRILGMSMPRFASRGNLKIQPDALEALRWARVLSAVLVAVDPAAAAPPVGLPGPP